MKGEGHRVFCKHMTVVLSTFLKPEKGLQDPSGFCCRSHLQRRPVGSSLQRFNENYLLLVQNS